MNGNLKNTHRTAGIATLFLLCLTATISWQYWVDEKANYVSMLTNVAELEARAVDIYLSQLGKDLRDLAEVLPQHEGRIDLSQAHMLAKKLVAQRSELVNVTLIEPNGDVLLTAKHAPGTLKVTLAQEASFIKFHDDLKRGKDLVIGQPMVSVASKMAIVPVRYAVRDSQGQLAYIISANLTHEYLRSFWVDTPITDQAAIGLIRDDGFLLSRYPVPGKLSLEQIYGVPRTGALIKYLTQQGFPEKGHIQGPNSLGGVEGLNAFRRLPNYPLTLFITTPVSEIWKGWVKRISGAYLAIMFLFIGGYGSYRHVIRRQISWDIQHQKLEAEKRDSDEQVRRLAFLDSLTNLPNRRLLIDRLSQAMLASKRSGKFMAMMFVDLDNFKSLNDQHGHEFGDLLLIEVANRLRIAVRENDTVSRFGGDEFVILLTELSVDVLTSTAQANSVAEKVLTALLKPYHLKVQHKGLSEISVEYQCTGSIGVRVFIDHKDSQNDILKDADAAMYKAKVAGRNTIRFHESVA
jgi:diguanylate cyclase (GGDEF)-like protein